MDKDRGIVSKSQSQLRWMILLLNCILMIGNYYCYDIPAALKTQMDDYMGNPGNFETLFSLLYTVYSIPNIFLPFFGGYFVDKFGVRLCLLLFVSLIAAGQVIFAFGLSIKSWPIMFVGRVVFGFGGESIAVANSSILADWFAGKEVAFAFGLNLSVARLGSVFNNLLSPVLADSAGVPFALWFGTILCASSVFCAMVVIPIDKGLEEKIAANKLAVEDSNLEVDLKRPRDEEDEDIEEEVKFKDVLSFPKPFWILVISCLVVYGCVLPFNNIASSLLLERDFFMEPPNKCVLTIPNECQSSSNPPIHCPSSDFYQPPLPINITIDDKYYAELTPDDIDCGDDDWSDGCAKEYCNRQSDGIKAAATVMSIPYIISACLSPVLGGFVDKFGMRAIIATLAPGCLVAVHLLMASTSVDPIGPMVGQGLAYSAFAAVIWPSVPLVVEKKFIGLGYGAITSIQNAGLACFPLIVAAIYKSSDDEYIPNVEFFFVALACLGVTVGILLNVYDVYHNNVFNSPGKPEDDAVYEALLGVEEDQGGRKHSAALDAPPRAVSKGSFSVQEEIYRARMKSS
mmetsp:Transcript_26228/g.38868  ORF Transcript_26228/g.38868 Transcript_26228/m.38868 type:complete len:571 (+) Transcript_26228:73-1785(+)